MKYETRIGASAGSVSIEDNRVIYQRESGPAVTGEFSCVEIDHGYSVVLNGRSYRVIPLPENEVSVNGVVFFAQIFDPRELRGRRGGESAGGSRPIAALMPGRVVRLLVEVGQAVEAGQGLIVVEAMKMQNEMKAPRSGTVTQIKTEPGAPVAAGDVLMVIE